MRRGEGGPKKYRIEGPPQPVRAPGAEPAFTPGCRGGKEGPFTPGCRPSLSHRLFPDGPIRTQDKTRISKQIAKQTIALLQNRCGREVFNYTFHKIKKSIFSSKFTGGFEKI